MIVNAEIDEIGLYVITHYGVSYVSMILNFDGGRCQVRIPDEDLLKFVRNVFDYDIPEDGFFLHELEGKYVRVEKDKDGEVCRVGHIMHDKWIDIRTIYQA